jgi:hypothetical protein
LKPKFFALEAISPQHQATINNTELLDKIKKALEKDKITINYRSLLKSGPQEFGKPPAEWNFENGLLLYCGKVYVPKLHKLRMELIKLHHNTLLAGHPGRWKTLELISRNYWWPGISIDVKKYVLGCDTCQRNKAHNKAPYGLLQPNKVPSEPWC